MQEQDSWLTVIKSRQTNNVDIQSSSQTSCANAAAEGRLDPTNKIGGRGATRRQMGLAGVTFRALAITVGVAGVAGVVAATAPPPASTSTQINSRNINIGRLTIALAGHGYKLDICTNDGENFSPNTPSETIEENPFSDNYDRTSADYDFNYYDRNLRYDVHPNEIRMVTPDEAQRIEQAAQMITRYQRRYDAIEQIADLGRRDEAWTRFYADYEVNRVSNPWIEALGGMGRDNLSNLYLGNTDIVIVSTHTDNSPSNNNLSAQNYFDNDLSHNDMNTESSPAQIQSIDPYADTPDYEAMSVAALVASDYNNVFNIDDRYETVADVVNDVSIDDN
ncbi:hypothetical protein [Mycobacterium attenuatum]|uniref:hypothetical protein n=1 Tax=Mycobacterium attenuatum TaxID=2341086 RepID=UPI0010A97443|nr:hypothetical protein [Mycobacterium attenuatum]